MLARHKRPASGSTEDFYGDDDDGDIGGAGSEVHHAPARSGNPEQTWRDDGRHGIAVTSSRVFMQIVMTASPKRGAESIFFTV